VLVESETDDAAAQAAAAAAATAAVVVVIECEADLVMRLLRGMSSSLDADETTPMK